MTRERPRSSTPPGAGAGAGERVSAPLAAAVPGPAEHEADALSAHLLETATTAAREAGALVAPWAGRVAVAAEKRGFFDPVTECDRAAEQLIAERIFQAHPDSTLIGEEGGARGDGAVHWYVDPIDGTNNFVAGIPFFCVSIAAALGDRMLAGVVYDPVRDELMAASTTGAFLNGAPIRCGGSATDAGATLLTSYPESGGRASDADLARFGELIRGFRAVRRLGSTALHLAYVACGRADASFERDTNAWDVGAGLFLVQQAGGRYLVPAGEGLTARRPWLSRLYVAACPELDLRHSVLQAVLWPAARGETAAVAA